MVKKGDFRFKKFSIEQSDCAQKVCTEACIFGAYLSKNFKAKQALDVGSGTGLLSLMYAQNHNNTPITGVEISQNCLIQSRHNLRKAEFEHRIHCIHADIRNCKLDTRYDLIFSNPPFYTSGNPSINKDTQIAKHDLTLQATDWIQILENYASSTTTIALLLSAHKILEKYTESFQKVGYTLSHTLKIRDTRSAKAGTLICTFDKKDTPSTCQYFSIKEEDLSYSQEMTQLLKDYYLYL